MKKILLGSVIAVSAVLLLSSGAAQNSGQEVVGTVSCPACVATGAKKIDLACARACLTKNKSTDVTKSTSADASAGITKNPNTDLTDSASTNLTKNTSTDLVIITDGDYKTVPVDNPDKVKSHLAHRVVVTGYWTRNGFHVISVRTL